MEKKKQKSLLTAFAGGTLREIVNYANENSIIRDNIVSLIKEGEQYILIYYKD